MRSTLQVVIRRLWHRKRKRPGGAGRLALTVGGVAYGLPVTGGTAALAAIARVEAVTGRPFR